jgi:hypothetical protein
MLLPLLLPLLLTSSQASPTLGSILAQPPEAAGEAILQGRDHGRIEKVAPAPRRGMDPPGLVQIELLEQPLATSRGCVRTRWTASFHQPSGAAESAATFADAYATTEVALPSASGCSNSRFVHVNPGLSSEEALDALAFLDELRAPASTVALSCADRTGSGLCGTPHRIRQELARLSPWVVTRAAGNIELWLGEPGQIVTAIRYSAAHRDRIEVERSVPAPF